MAAIVVAVGVVGRTLTNTPWSVAAIVLVVVRVVEIAGDLGVSVIDVFGVVDYGGQHSRGDVATPRSIPLSSGPRHEQKPTSTASCSLLHSSISAFTLLPIQMIRLPRPSRLLLTDTTRSCYHRVCCQRGFAPLGPPGRLRLEW